MQNNEPASTNSETPELSPAAREALYATGHDLFTESRFAEAAAVFRLMLQVAPTDERGWLALGACHEQVGQLDLALELYGAGTVAAENAARCALARARLLKKDDQEIEAFDSLDEALRFAETSGDEELALCVEAERNSWSCTP